ncbi:MAG: Asp-tRNA(Asn)/Glu-tRNA(Gln) amidotransferase subunit GatC [Pseudobdellovibrionaceae bacterium]|nr:Asp-tRNA(Asn)/Glu-tRNA(Gln) amidotransferase subunit GatC [Bdellovibrionales bacterium]USN46806.1 MAG: Asp-tRNA(Asn)/Glu-tRNA(Gln) amidotransferase subunit GatC [Pseudobdellovibrionaceae bacterium]
MIDIEKVVKLARLTITEDEAKQYSEQIPAILEYFEKISKVNTKGVEPLVTPTPMEQHLREDKVQPGLGAEKALANAPEKSGHLFKVPPVV